MKLNWKKIIIIVGFIALVILIGYLLYALFLKPAIPTQITNQNVNTGTGGLGGANTNANIPVAVNVNGTLPGINQNVDIGPPPDIEPTTPIASPTATGGLTQTTALTSDQAFQPTLAANGQNSIYYDKISGLFYQVTPNGVVTKLSDQVFYNVQNITWAPNKTKAVLEYPDGANIIYDFSTEKQITLPSHWKDFNFSPNSDQLVFKSMGLNTENRWLAITNSDGSQAKKLELLGNKDATVYPSWSPNNQIVAMYTEDDSFDRQKLYFVGLNDENFKATMIEGRGFESQWSTNGDRLLYSVYHSASGYRPVLWIVEAQGEKIGNNRRSLDLATWADKCTFSNNDTVYCAVPQSLPEGSGIFKNDFDTTACDIYKIDLTTGFRNKVAVPEGEHNIGDIMVSQNEKYLYFVSQNDGKLYKINLQ